MAQEEKKNCIQKIVHKYDRLTPENKIAVIGFLGGAASFIRLYFIMNHHSPMQNDIFWATLPFFSLTGALIMALAGSLIVSALRHHSCTRRCVESFDPPPYLPLQNL